MFKFKKKKITKLGEIFKLKLIIKGLNYTIRHDGILHRTAQLNKQNRHFSPLTNNLLTVGHCDFINSSTVMSEAKTGFHHEKRYSPQLGSGTAETGEMYRERVT